LRTEKGESRGLCREKAESKRQAKRAPDYEWKAKEKPSGKIKQDALQLQVECLPSTFVTLIKNSTNKQTKKAVFFPRYCLGA